MPEQVLTNAHLTVNAVDLSDHVKSVTLRYEAELQDPTVMGDNTRRTIGGLKNWQIDVSFAQDFDAGEVDATLFPIVGSAVAIAVRPVNAGISATNPEYSGQGVLESYSPITGGVGDFHEVPVTFRPAGDLSRATS